MRKGRAPLLFSAVLRRCKEPITVTQVYSLTFDLSCILTTVIYRFTMTPHLQDRGAAPV